MPVYHPHVMNRFHIRSLAPDLLAVAGALVFALGGIAVVEIVLLVTGQFVTAILVLPVVVAAWYGGLFVGALTIALETMFAALALPPVFRFAVESNAEVVRLTVAVGVSVVALFIVIRLRALERRFRAVVTVALEGIWTIDAGGRTTYVNPRMAEILGYTPSEMRGRRFSEFVRDEDVPTVERGFQDRKQGMPARSECELIRKDGSSVWIHYAGTPMMDGSRFTGALAVVTDISERKRQDVTIREQAARLEQANRQKDHFLAMLGHELRNPLTPLVTAMKLMELKSDGSFQRERAVIVRQVEHLTRLVDDISDVSRFRHGKLHIRSETVDVAQVVREACEMVAPLIARQKHRLDVDVPDALVTEGDSARLRQVVVNLLTNAAKYTSLGGHVSVVAQESEGHIVVRVQDNGVGIPSDFLPILFDPFTQKRESLDQSDGGLGLGLAIVNGIVLAHGGRIEVRSEGAGHGSEFVVRLPIVMPGASAALGTTQGLGERRIVEPS